MKNKRNKCHRHVILTILALTMIVGSFLLKGSQNVEAATDYPYLLKINRKMCVVTVYEKDAKGNYTVPIKAMLCSPGYDTPLGTFKTPEKYRWRLLMGDVWGQYSTRITGGILFHSVWYYEKDPSTLSNKQYNKLGTICSHGCVRLNVEDAKWIYDNCPIGTTVVIYDSSNPGPLGKPEAIKVSESTLMGYDPTDIWSEGNPYITAKPSIEGVKDQTLEYGQKAELTKGVKATASTGGDITSKLTVSIQYEGKKVKKVNTKKAGKYYVTYSVTDNAGKTVKKEAVFEVVDNVAPKIKGLKELYYQNTELDKEAIDSTIVVKWHGKEISKKEVDITWKVLKEKEDIKKYKVTYSYTASNGKRVTATAKVICDLEAPVFVGVEDGMVISEEQLTRKFLLSAVMAKDNISGYIMDKDIQVEVEKQEDETYKVTYTTSDIAGNIGKAEAIYSIIPGVTITGVEKRTISAEQIVDEAFVLEGVKAYENGEDITEQLTVSIVELEKEYQVTYKVADSNGEVKTEMTVYTVESK